MYLKRWRLRKINSRTGIEVPSPRPEPVRAFWSRTGAVAEAERLNTGLRYLHSRWLYAVRRR